MSDTPLALQVLPAGVCVRNADTRNLAVAGVDYL